MVAHVPGKSHGIATYVRNRISNFKVISQFVRSDVYLIVVEISGVIVTNVYKPPNSTWTNSPIIAQSGPSVYIGDFNSHHTVWGYSEDDNNGELLCTWAERNQLHLLFDAKERGTFRSARWRRDYNPDLCFVSSNERNEPITASRKVLKSFPHSQHRPVIVSVGVSIPIIESIPKPRWNFQKANWQKYQQEVDANLRWIPPKRCNYKRFVGVVNAAAKRCIPRGFRKEYIPGWNDNIEQLYREFEESGDPKILEELLDALNAARREKWAKTTANIDFTPIRNSE